MHNSTLSKVGFLNSTIRKMVTGKLRTASRGFGVAPTVFSKAGQPKRLPWWVHCLELELGLGSVFSG